MKLEDQVVSISLATRMKELGFEQESLFWWHLPNEQEAFIVKSKIDEYAISAYTVAELGMMLPEKTCWRGYSNNGNKWGLEFGDFRAEEEKEADARAKMLIYLAENGLINPKPQSNE